MDIEQIRKKRDTLGTAIRDLLIAFSNETELEVEAIRFEMSVIQMWGTDNPSVSCTSVVVELEEL